MKNSVQNFARYLTMLGSLGVSSWGMSTTFTLTNNGNGNTFLCQPNNGGGHDDFDPACSTQVREICDLETTYSDDQCFSKAVEACGNGASGPCVKDVFADCDLETTLSDDACFDQSLKACGGDRAGIRAIVEATREKSLEDFKSKTFPR